MAQIIKIDSRGNFKKSKKLLYSLSDIIKINVLEKYGKIGVQNLEKYTPKDTGLTSESWYYTIETDNRGKYSLIFHNSNIHNYVNIAIILQTGHATGNGGWVEGVDYINPALKPVFEKMVDEVWAEVKYL